MTFIHLVTSSILLQYVSSNIRLFHTTLLKRIHHKHHHKNNCYLTVFLANPQEIQPENSKTKAQSLGLFHKKVLII